MKKEIKITLSRRQIEKVCRDYHFCGADQELLERMAGELQQAAEPLFFHQIPEGRYPQNVPYEEYALCLATLGKKTDNLIEAYGKAGSLLESYMLECLSMEMLFLLYEEGRKEIERKHGFVGGYYFFEDDLGEWIESFAGEAGNPVEYREGCLIPQKSVIYAAALSKEKTEPKRICQNCPRRDCIRGIAFH